MEKEPPLSGSTPEQELTEVQRFWLRRYQACQMANQSLAEYAREPGWRSNRSTTGKDDCGSSKPLSPNHSGSRLSPRFMPSGSGGLRWLRPPVDFTSPMA